MPIPVLAIILLIIVTLLLRNRKSSESIFEVETEETISVDPATPKPEKAWLSRIKEGWNKLNPDVRWTLLGFAYLYCFLWWMFPTWWTQYMVTFWFLVVATGFTLFGLMREKSKNPFRYALAKFGTAVMVVAVIWRFYGEPRWVAKSAAEEVLRLGAEVIAIPPPFNDAGKEIVSKFLRKKYSGEKAEEMIAIAERVSQFNQFEVDGKTPHWGRDNPQHVGVMHIDRSYWQEQAEALGYPLSTFEGNLEMFYWICEHASVDEWSDNPEVRQLSRKRGITIIAPAGSWDDKEVVATPSTFNWRTAGDLDQVNILVNKNLVDERKVVPKNLTDPIKLGGGIKTLLFQSTGPDAVKVTVFR